MIKLNGTQVVFLWRREMGYVPILYSFHNKIFETKQNGFSFHDKLTNQTFFLFELHNVFGEFSEWILNYSFRTMDKTRVKTYFQQKSEIIFVFTVMNLSEIMNTRNTANQSMILYEQVINLKEGESLLIWRITSNNKSPL